MHDVFPHCVSSNVRLLLVRIIVVAVAVEKLINLALFPFELVSGHWLPCSDGLSPPPSSAPASASASTC